MHQNFSISNNNNNNNNVIQIMDYYNDSFDVNGNNKYYYVYNTILFSDTHNYIKKFNSLNKNVYNKYSK
jgi:hypothetical protein